MLSRPNSTVSSDTVFADGLPEELAGRFRPEVVLKRDQLSTIERGTFVGSEGEVPAVLRRIDGVPLWTRWLATGFLKREARALAIAGKLGVAPPLLFKGDLVLVRGWLPGLPLQIAKPFDDLAYFRSAKLALRAIHKRGLTHNDLAKKPNWLRAPDGRALLTDFQLATLFPRRGRLFRWFAYEDLRPLLKHKRTFCESALTPSERRVLGRKMIITRTWMALGKPIYRLITRGILRHADSEGGGSRLNRDAPAIRQRLLGRPGVKAAAVVTYPDRRRGVGLYAFVEAPGESEASLRAHLGAAQNPPRLPELIQLVSGFPRDKTGEIRSEILQLVALNQIDALRSIVREDERAIVDAIVAGRLNLLDRH